LISIYTGDIGIGASGAELVALNASRGVTAKAAFVVVSCEERMFYPGLADVLEALVVVGASTHPVEILRNDRVASVRQRKPI
jgi:hypothetical protein